MFLIVIVAVLFVFAGSMKVSDKVLAERSQHDISKLQNGDYIFEKFRRNEDGARILILKDWDSNLYVHLVPLEQEKVPMPEPFWGFGYYHCKYFGPDHDVNHKLLKSGKIRCHDDEAPKWMVDDQWVWEYSGKAAAGSWSHDMISPKYEIKGNTVYING